MEPEHVAYLRFKTRNDTGETYLQLCDSDSVGAFKVYRESEVASGFHMYVWTRKPLFIGIAQAKSVAKARELVLAQIGHGDGSCPERDSAAAFVEANTPEIWYGPNAEFELTDSAELREQIAYVERLEKRVVELELGQQQQLMLHKAECACIPTYAQFVEHIRGLMNDPRLNLGNGLVELALRDFDTNMKSPRKDTAK